ncbi:MAG: SDR family oxidoreductase [Rhodospirillales bacterium]
MEAGLAGRVAVVTGGASGIGRAVVELLSAEGAKVVVADRDAAAGEALAAARGGRFQALDVGDEAAVAAAMAEIEASDGPIAVLVTCAGILQRTLPPSELSWKEWDLVQRIHLRGTYACCAEAGRYMVERGAGSIVTVASVAGMRSGPLHSYGPAKAGIISLTECLAGEWGRRGVRVNAVAPGFTETPALKRGFDVEALDRETLSEASALGRLVGAEEIAKAVVFLASDLASAVTGTTLPVDAGYLIATPWAAYGGIRQP